MSQQAYPLHWPAGWPRTAVPMREHKFGDHSVYQAVEELSRQLDLLKATGMVISSNVALGNTQPKDKGVCVYFTLRAKPYALPCDKWDRVEDNLWALAKHIEALRGQQRWGVGTVERAFAGYMAITDGKKTWREVFGFGPADRPTAREINDRYRDLALRRHPDHGGSTEAMAELNMARDMARTEGLIA
jgi:hypothetical protein